MKLYSKLRFASSRTYFWGSVIRMRRDGSFPEGNPFVGKARAAWHLERGEVDDVHLGDDSWTTQIRIWL